jgi:hypothetical protein
MPISQIAGELAGDFIFWPTGKRRLGLYLTQNTDLLPNQADALRVILV